VIVLPYPPRVDALHRWVGAGDGFSTTIAPRFSPILGAAGAVWAALSRATLPPNIRKDPLMCDRGQLLARCMWR
jgi:hypothetical protein